MPDLYLAKDNSYSLIIAVSHLSMLLAHRFRLNHLLTRCLMPIVLLFTCLMATGCYERKAPPFIVVSADDRATQAGIDILQKGGSAIDAAVAVQAVLSLVEPQSSGVGGGAFLVYYDAQGRQLHTIDGREMAPASITPHLYLDEQGQAKSYRASAFGGQAVGVPGVMALLDKAHGRYGTLPWQQLLSHAEQLAEQGFAVSPRLSGWLARFPNTGAHPDMLHYFYDEQGEARPAGFILKNPAYAQTMRVTAKEGASSFYTGTIAKQIAQAVSESPISPRPFTLDDLAAYEAKDREAICSYYKQYKVCGMGPPTSGGLFILQVLGMLEHFELQQEAPFSAEALHLIIEASRLAFADRQQFVADPDFVDVPIKGMLDKDYLHSRVGLINTEKAAKAYLSGRPENFDLAKNDYLLQAPHEGLELPSTSHFSIRDAQGNVVSMTTTVQGPFGSFLPAGGFILNNQLTDFSYLPEKDGKPIANAAAPGKRPRSSMSPTIVFDENDEVYMVIGSPGGGRIFSYVLKTLLGVLDWNMSMQQAIDAPNLTFPGGRLELEVEGYSDAVIEALQNKGHTFKETRQESGLNGFVITETGYDAGADKRREGTYQIAYP